MQNKVFRWSLALALVAGALAVNPAEAKHNNGGGFGGGSFNAFTNGNGGNGNHFGWNRGVGNPHRGMMGNGSCGNGGNWGGNWGGNSGGSCGNWGGNSGGNFGNGRHHHHHGTTSWNNNNNWGNNNSGNNNWGNNWNNRWNNTNNGSRLSSQISRIQNALASGNLSTQQQTFLQDRLTRLQQKQANLASGNGTGTGLRNLLGF